MNKSFTAIFLVYLSFLALPDLGLTQNTPFLSASEINMLANEISGDRAFEHIRWLSHWHRNSGSEAYFKAVDYVVQAAKAAGLEDVRFVEQPLRSKSYNPRAGELWIVEPIEVKLADIGDHALYLSDGSHDADLSAELVWIGDGSKAMLEDVDVHGKIVLTDAGPESAVRNAVWGKGALGVVAYPTSEGKSAMDYPDQIAWARIRMTPPEGKPGTFAFTLPPRKGHMLRQLLDTNKMQDIFATGKKTLGGHVVLRAKVDTEISENNGRTGFVEGWIRGSKYHNQQIVLTAHLQEEQGSANDDGSGCGNLLELARTFTKLIAEGKMQQPHRDIRFWWTDEIYSEYRYFMDHPDEPKNFLANLHQDMTGADQAMGSRVQHLIFAPHSRTSYLDAIFESIGTYLIQTNNAYLSAGRQGGLPRPHSRPIYATRGSRAGYHATFVPYFDSSDHMCFVEGIIGVPAVAMINWDDDFIHSSDDDLDKIDQTQLQRNNFLIGSMAYYLAFAEEADVPVLAGETFSQGGKRLANDAKVAMSLVRIPGDGTTNAWKDANLIIEQGIKRELRALNSVRVFSSNNSNTQLIKKLVARLQSKKREIISDLGTYYRQIHGTGPPSIQLTAEERAASKKVPANSTSLQDYFTNRNKVRVDDNLHGLMEDEAYNFVDGKHSYYDIYKAVRAEAMAAGAWYYGTVSLADVVGLLDAAVEAKVMTLK
ncbi:MAG: M28 family peptidase [bacterium]